ncbi:MAG TPA: hypothetical protein EYP41_07440 [Anaerolineae bacterium]|nr:hypothetical protein [Anaerolineae bacterium]HIP70950.1 hypothetical protein [Anaerolineae bacterium]
MDTIHLPPDFKEFLQLLNTRNVKYLLIGGYAVGYHGYPRATIDMDIWVAIHPENAVRIAQVLKEFGFDSPDLSESLFLEENKIVRMGIPPMRLEILTTISGVNFDECYSKRIVDLVDDVEINIINLEHLKRNKKASGRHKDLNDLENLP